MCDKKKVELMFFYPRFSQNRVSFHFLNMRHVIQNVSRKQRVRRFSLITAAKNYCMKTFKQMPGKEKEVSKKENKMFQSLLPAMQDKIQKQVYSIISYLETLTKKVETIEAQYNATYVAFEEIKLQQVQQHQQQQKLQQQVHQQQQKWQKTATTKMKTTTTTTTT